MKKTIRALLITVLMVLFSFCGGNKKQEDKSEDVPAIPVETALVTKGTVYARYSGTTTLEAEAEAQVVARVGGVVNKVLAEEGQKVREGQPLLKIDDSQYLLELAQAEANFNKINNEYTRGKELFENHYLSAEAFERLKFDYETQKANLKLAQLRLDYTEVRSPFSGIVSERMIKAGNMVAANQSVFRVTDFDPMLAVMHVPEKELSKLKQGMKADINADALGDVVFSGNVIRISPVISAETGTFKVTLEVSDEKDILKPGMFIRVAIIYDRHENTLLVPKDAVLTEDTEHSVFLVNNAPSKGANRAGKEDAGPKGPVAEKRIISIGYINSTHIEVLSGVGEGVRIITTGLASLKDGSVISVVDQ